MRPTGPDTSEITCPIGLFGRIEEEAAVITAAINRASTVAEKVPLAGDLRSTVAALLACEAHDESDVNCRLCGEFSELRDKTAALIQQVARLAGGGGDG